LLQRHNHLEEEIKAFEEDIKRLDEHASLMTRAAAPNGNAVSIGISAARNLEIE